MKSPASLGVQNIIHPEPKGGLQIVGRTLLQLGFPLSEGQEYSDTVRGDYDDSSVNTKQERQLLQDLLSARDSIGIARLRLATKNSLVGRSLAEANLRATRFTCWSSLRRRRDQFSSMRKGR